eukprot:2601904-Pyramimonas_sp.AAC.1
MPGVHQTSSGLRPRHDEVRRTVRRANARQRTEAPEVEPPQEDGRHPPSMRNQRRTSRHA